jgi:putative ABC transport system ATP-binding protein
MGGTIVHAREVSKLYEPDTWALRGVTLDVEKGSWVTIMGPSGSGKTTLLNMIGCLDSPTGGSLLIQGTDVTKLGQKALACFRRENLGLVFQQYHMVSYLTALENVMLAQYYHSVVDEEGAVEALERVGLGHRLTHTPSQLSGGEQQRVCIARALVNDQEILLADEPTGNLDMKNGEIVLDLIKDLHDDDHTIILITHNPEIAKMGEVLVELLDGQAVSSRHVVGPVGGG